MQDSQSLKIGQVYSRAQLKTLFEVKDASINNGIFRRSNSKSIWLFVTQNKTSDRTPYLDSLDGDILTMQGQSKGRTDRLIVQHEQDGVELLLFYRTEKYQHASAGFTYYGKFRYQSHSGATPTTFTLLRTPLENASQAFNSINLELAQIGETLESESTFDVNDLKDARQRTQSNIVRRLGQPKFRQLLLDVYSHTCAVTDCKIAPILEAAHIVPYQGQQTNIAANGLLLRTDIHTLFDLKLASIDPVSLEFVLTPELQASEYGPLHRKKLDHPSTYRKHLMGLT